MKRKEFINRSAILGTSLVLGNRLLGKGLGLIADKDSRRVLQVLNPHATKVGTLPILRLFPGGEKDYISPFVLFDEFGPVDLIHGSKPLRVDPHPHAGVVPTTYFMAGSGHHKDSLNFDFQIETGEFMMFSSGRGAIHMEETGTDMNKGGTYHGFQIWLNLPAKDKYIDPTTTVLKEGSIPIVQRKEFELKVIMGSFEGLSSPAKTSSPVFYYHISTQKNARLSIEIDPTHNAFLYAIDDKVELAEQTFLDKNHIAVFEREKSIIELYTPEATNLLLMGGLPLNDPIVSYGPFVMNTEAQIQQCIRDYQTGRMGDPKRVN